MSAERIGQSIEGSSDLTALEGRAAKIDSALTKIHRVSTTLGTSQFEAQSGKEFPQFEAEDAENVDFIQNSIRVGKINRQLITNARPTLMELKNAVEQRIHALEEEEKLHSQIRNAELELDRLVELKDFIPNAQVAIAEADRRVNQLKSGLSPQKENISSETKTGTTETPAEKTEPEEIDQTVREGSYRKVKGTLLLPSGETLVLGGKKGQILKLLLEKPHTLYELADKVYGNTDEKNRSNISAFISQMYDDIYRANYMIARSITGKGRDRRVVLSLAPRQEENPQAMVGKKKEAPFMHPITEARLQALTYIATGAQTQDIIELLGNTKRGKAFNVSEARSALWHNMDMLRIRVYRKTATKDELRVWEIVKTAVEGAKNDSEVHKAFKERIYEFFHGKKENNADKSTLEAEGQSTEAETSSEDKLTLYEGAVLAKLILEHNKITIKGEHGNNIEFKLPEEIEKSCEEVIRKYMVEEPDRKKVEDLNEFRQRILDKISSAFEKDLGEAIDFVERHSNSLQEVLYWLESEREYVFELLVHHVEITNTIDHRRLDLLRQARTIARIGNSAFKMLEERLSRQGKDEPLL